jgi:hypothetical protein
MTAVPEKTVLISMGVVTFLCTSTHMIQEVLARQSRGLEHFPRFYLSAYLGKVVLSQISFPLVDHANFVLSNM